MSGIRRSLRIKEHEAKKAMPLTTIALKRASKPTKKKTRAGKKPSTLASGTDRVPKTLKSDALIIPSKLIRSKKVSKAVKVRVAATVKVFQQDLKNIKLPNPLPKLKDYKPVMERFFTARDRLEALEERLRRGQVEDNQLANIKAVINAYREDKVEDGAVWSQGRRTSLNALYRSKSKIKGPVWVEKMYLMTYNAAVYPSRHSQWHSNEINFLIRLSPAFGGNPNHSISVKVYNDTGSDIQTLTTSDLNDLAVPSDYQGWTQLEDIATAGGSVSRQTIQLEIAVMNQNGTEPLTPWLPERAIVQPPISSQIMRCSGTAARTWLYFTTSPFIINSELFVGQSKADLTAVLPTMPGNDPPSP